MHHHYIVFMTAFSALCTLAQSDAPSVYLSPEEKTIASRGTLRLTCRVDSSPNLVVTWSLEGKELGQSGDPARDIFIKDYNARRGYTQLEIVEADANNVGRYECRAVSDTGEDSATANIELQGHVVECVPEDQGYCNNNGICLMNAGSTGDDKHCKCNADYEGPRCEQRHIETDFSKESWFDMSKLELVGIAGVIIALFVVVVISVVAYRRYRRRTYQDTQGLTLGSVEQDAENGKGITNQAVQQTDRSPILQNGNQWPR